jgi:hypothetical protein
MKIETLNDGLNQIVKCRDGSHRRLLSVGEKEVVYEVPITRDFWRDLGPTRRKAVEELFIGAEVVTTEQWRLM